MALFFFLLWKKLETIPVTPSTTLSPTTAIAFEKLSTTLNNPFNDFDFCSKSSNNALALSTVWINFIPNIITTTNKIEPKIQATYGFSDLGRIQGLNIDGYLSMDDGSFVTTHKIGYEDCDRYRIGKDTCDSFLFLSPSNHSDIQVNGDTSNSHISIKSNESLRVPIIYQYRMEDYNGNIFGDKNLRTTDATVKNTKYANIIGVDIWLNTMSDTPKQYDIVVYSTYGKANMISVGTVTSKIKL